MVKKVFTNKVWMYNYVRIAKSHAQFGGRHTCKACSSSFPVQYIDDGKCGMCKAPVVPVISADSTRAAWAPVARTLVSMENAHNKVVAKLNAAHAKKTDAYNTKLAKHREKVAEIQLAETQKKQEAEAESVPQREGGRKRKHVNYAEDSSYSPAYASSECSDSDNEDESFEPPSNKRSKKIPSKPQPPQPPNVVSFRAESMVIGHVAY